MNILKSKWHEIIAVVSVIAMISYFIIKAVWSLQLANLALWMLIVVGGIPLMIQIILQAFKGDLGADLLALIGLIVAVFLEEFLAASLVILMISSGQALEVYAAKKASFVLEALANRMPAIAHKKVGDKVVDIAISDINIGDVIEIYPHETCPVDGVVVSGQGEMDESYLTGEPYHISKGSGCSVLSGAINRNTAFTIRAQKLPKDSRYSTIIAVMENAENNRPKMRRLADQIGAVFAPLALLFAVATLLITGSATNFLAVLVVATPCPLLIAIPISIISAISIAARHGIIIKDPAILEKLPLCSTAIFDKTGTLTAGKPELKNIVMLSDFDRNAVLQMAASLERYSRHPLSCAIIEAAQEKNLELLEVNNISENKGKGLVGDILGKKVFVTNRQHVSDILHDQMDQLPALKRGLECVVVIDDQIAAMFHFRDKPRHDGHLFINHLGPDHNFNKVMLVSGDHSSEVEYLASLLEIKETYASQTPEQKLEIVRRENANAPTLFMGDGINDAPALTAATAGIAFGQHEAVTSQAAGAVIMDSSLAKVDQLIHISESMRSIALQSAIGGMILSVVGMGFAAAGMLSPVSAALLQEVIDVVAILNALRLTWRPSIDADV